MEKNKSITAVEWLVEQLFADNEIFGCSKELLEQAEEMEKQQQDTFAIDFAEWYEEDVLAKGDYEMIAKDKKELLEIFKETYGKQ